MLEEDHPASKSSGRNGGNFQLLSESYVGKYDGIVAEKLKWLKSQNPSAGPAELEQMKVQAETDARVVVEFTFKNFYRFHKMVNEAKIQCDFSPQGWLRIASSLDEEQALIEDTHWLSKFSVKPLVEVWSPEMVMQRMNIPARYSARYVEGSGNYHPYKFVTSVLRRAVDRGVLLYTGVKVEKVSQGSRGVMIRTSEGAIHAKRVIVATNAFTPEIFPELKSIQTVPSQILNLENVKNNLQGMTSTEQNGDIYYNFPTSQHVAEPGVGSKGMVHFGLDWHHSVDDLRTLAPSFEVFEQMRQLTDERFPETRGQPPSRTWVGPMAFTPDRVPMIGRLSKNVIIAAAFQGYGGSYCIQAGYVAARMASTGRSHPDVPARIFSPRRFFSQKGL